METGPAPRRMSWQTNQEGHVTGHGGYATSERREGRAGETSQVGLRPSWRMGKLVTSNGNERTAEGRA